GRARGRDALSDLPQSGPHGALVRGLPDRRLRPAERPRGAASRPRLRGNRTRLPAAPEKRVNTSASTIDRTSIAIRVARLDWQAIELALDERGHATTPPLLAPAECTALARLFRDDRRFRSRIDMARYRFGVGEHKYFAEPLPRLVAALRAEAYPRLAPIANRWDSALGGRGKAYPEDLERFLAVCAEHGQTKPTPLLLQYGAGGYNCLHQDLYGAVAFPLQLTCVLSRRG